jgi:hypothetical protein
MFGEYGCGLYQVVTDIEYWYTVTYRGHTVISTDLGAAISQCYAAAA